MDKLSDNLKKIFLAGIGAVAVTAEKSKDLLDEMVEKGELTVEQGKVLNEELKHNVKKTVKEKVNALKPASAEELSDLLDKMTPEQIAQAIRYIDGRAKTECSGNMTKENIRTVTELGVDYVSSGALTHSAPILDISLKHLKVLTD